MMSNDHRARGSPNLDELLAIYSMSVGAPIPQLGTQLFVQVAHLLLVKCRLFQLTFYAVPPVL